MHSRSDDERIADCGQLTEPTAREILNLTAVSEYDFRVTACPTDRLRDQFPEWVSYYRAKWAVARLLKPRSILEVGVRYGYSAAAFLDGCNSARYLGIDPDSEEFGGSRDGIGWARRITAGYSAQFIVADTREMARFPGEIYDLIHIDLQRNADESFRDLDLAIQQGRFVLTGGCFRTPQSPLAISTFLYRNRELVEYYMVIPNNGGELLIKTYPSIFKTPKSPMVAASEELRQTYTSEYYLSDCGGFTEYQNTGGKKLEDDRLATVAAVASLKAGGRVLDLGCGRGELAYYFSQQGSKVTAIDYSDDAIRLTEQTFEGDPDLRSRVEVRHANVCNVELSGVYDLAVASDAVEHLTSQELDVLYAKVAQHLTPDGILLIHTYPNLWYFKYDYARKRRLASSLGAYLPREPRTRYELLMHINEQNPRLLKRQLRKYFANVLLWFGEPGNMGGSLLRPYSHRQLAASRDLWAVASQYHLDSDAVRSRLHSHPLTPDQMRAIDLTPKNLLSTVRAGHQFLVTLEISNHSGNTLKSMQPFPVHISYHWMRSNGELAIFDGVRTRIQPFLAPGWTRSFNARVMPPSLPGKYILRLTLVQEGVQWFDLPPIEVKADSQVEVVP